MSNLFSDSMMCVICVVCVVCVVYVSGNGYLILGVLPNDIQMPAKSYVFFWKKEER